MVKNPKRAWFSRSLLGATAAALVVSASIADEAIRLNSIGFLPARAKVATVAEEQESTFAVKRVEDGSLVYSGRLSEPRLNADTEERLRTADFTELTEPGRYYLELGGGQRSAAFRIAQDVYDGSLRVNLLGFLGQRCGQAIRFERDGEVFAHAACHHDDGELEFYEGGAGHKDGTGGWHDAGDYGKYIVNSGITVGMMLQAWERFEDTLKTYRLPDLPEDERGNAIPDFLDEVKYNLDWALKMQFEGGKVSHKLTRQRFAPFIMPSEDVEMRYFSPWSTAATADFVAMTAMAARIYEPYDPAFAQRCLEAAWHSYRLLQARPQPLRADLSAFRTGPYQTDDEDDRLWAAAELWATTGDAEAHADFLDRARALAEKVELDWDWGSVSNLGVFTYLLTDREGKDAELLAAIEREVIRVADQLVANRDGHGYGRGIVRYYWGANGTVARSTMLLQAAYALRPSSEYLDAAVDQLGHLYGRNYYSRSFVTGEGLNPPKHPHHRPSGADQVEAPWPGHLVGGGHPGAMDWLDEQASYATNENAINWDGAMTFALAMFAGSEEER